MADVNYELEYYIPDADQVWIPDQDGTDWISVRYRHDQPVEIALSYQTGSSGETYSALAFYYGQDGRCHRMIIFGMVEHAAGSPGVDKISGNELDNLLMGERDLLGLGDSDTIYGGRGNDTVLGGAGDDLLSGGDGEDEMSGHVGADTLLGGAGRDTLWGGKGADLIDGGSDAGDTVSYVGSAAGVRITLNPGSVSVAAGGDAAGDTILGVSDIIGTGFNDRLVDAEKATMAEGANANLFQGGGGRDILMLGGGDDTGLGGLGGDFLFGEAGNDDLQGSAGNDRLTGGAGQDTLTGGLGADRFIFNRLVDSGADAATCDVITDFGGDAGDLLVFMRIDADTTLRGNQAFFLGEGGFTGRAGELVQEVTEAGLLLQADVTGDGLADFALLLQGVTQVEAAHLVL